MMDHTLDSAREHRMGVPEAILASGKTTAQIAAIIDTVLAAGEGMLITRLSERKAQALVRSGPDLRYDPASHTAEIGPARMITGAAVVAVVAAGTSDLRVAHEAARSLAFFGQPTLMIADVGGAGLWRLMAKLADKRRCPVVIAVAGMEGALFSVLAGLVRAPVIAVPTSVGYGVSKGGRAALSSALATCAPGVVVVNIDNGFGAAAAAVKILRVAEALVPDGLPSSRNP